MRVDIAVAWRNARGDRQIDRQNGRLLHSHSLNARRVVRDDAIDLGICNDRLHMIGAQIWRGKNDAPYKPVKLDHGDAAKDL